MVHPKNGRKGSMRILCLFSQWKSRDLKNSYCWRVCYHRKLLPSSAQFWLRCQMRTRHKDEPTEKPYTICPLHVWQKTEKRFLCVVFFLTTLCIYRFYLSGFFISFRSFSFHDSPSIKKTQSVRCTKITEKIRSHGRQLNRINFIKWSKGKIH